MWRTFALMKKHVDTVSKHEFRFPVGYERFHKDQLFNFQLNRPYSFGYAKFEDLKEAGSRIKSFTDWKREMLNQAEKAVSENRLINAAFYYRAAEFYAKSNDPEKEILYDTFIRFFYKAFENEKIEKHFIPYGGVYLPAIKVPSSGGKKGNVVIHG